MPTPEELYQRGLSLGSEGKRKEAYRCHLKAAERGHAKAQNMVGRFLDEGWAG